MKTLLKKWFPPMMDSLRPVNIFVILVYWLFAFSIIPVGITLLPYGGLNDTCGLSWVECVYCAINGIVMALILKENLQSSLLAARLNSRAFAGTAGIASGLMVLYVLLVWGIGAMAGAPGLMATAFPMTQMSVSVTAGTMVSTLPIWGTLCLTFLMPFAITGLFYAVGFAPVCKHKPWLAYLNIAFLILLPAVLDMLWRGNVGSVMTIYLLRLPVHLIACWSYQKTDSVLTPIVSLSAVNLLTSLVGIFFA